MLQEDTKFWVGVRFNGGLENGEEDVFQHFSKVWHKVLASENVTTGGNNGYTVRTVFTKTECEK